MGICANLKQTRRFDALGKRLLLFSDGVIDNVIRKGAVAHANSHDACVLGVRRLNEASAKEPRVSATEIQTVGSKGYDGFAFVLVTA